MSDSKRIQVNMSRELRDALRAISSELNIALDADDIGTASAAAIILEALTKSPDLLKQLKRRGLEIEAKKRRPPRPGEEQAAFSR